MSALRSVAEQVDPDREQGEGTLLQVDLVGSTRIARRLGGEPWKRYQREFLEETRRVAEKFGFVPEMLIWDAVFLTRSKSPESGELVEFTNEIVRRVNALNDRFGVGSESDLVRCVRVCAAFGDIARESRNGLPSVTGYAMFRIRKLEQAVKEMDLVLAVSEEIAARWTETGIFGSHKLKNAAVVLGVCYEDIGGTVLRAA